MQPEPTEAERRRFLAKVDRSAGLAECWPWTGARMAKGYGVVMFRSRTSRAHRVSYELFVAQIPSGLCVLHSCDNPSCVNPGHLFVGTKSDNSRDSVAKGRWRRHCGEESGLAKLTTAQVVAIRNRYAAGGVTLRELASEYRMGQSALSSMIRRKTWSHVA